MPNKKKKEDEVRYGASKRAIKCIHDIYYSGDGSTYININYYDVY